jgi:hypothetical protein
MGLILWIATFVFMLEDLLAYVDDTFSWEFEDNFLFYPQYQKAFPAKQTRLLQVWDELGIPHEDSKQVFGDRLTIIGLDVDPNTMTITMPEQAHSDLITVIRSFVHPGQCRPLRKFQCLAGWMNWSLNAYPLLRPGMSALYHKMSGKTEAHQLIWVSVSLCHELNWFVHGLENSGGVHMMTSRGWGKNDADVSLLCDACPHGMGFWCPSCNIGFVHSFDASQASPGIFYFEALTVISALHWALHNMSMRPNTHVAIYTDNSNTVDMFNTLRAQPPYNLLLTTTVDLILQHDIQLRVFHISGDDNLIADALSCCRFDVVAAHAPWLAIYLFPPPRLTLGAMVL